MGSVLTIFSTALFALAGTAALAQDLSGLEAEPQEITGRFLTATEVKPVLQATQANWIAVREFEGQDLVYVTHLWAWRCGLARIDVAINDGPFEVWPMPDCHADEGSPGAIKSGDGDPFRSFAGGSVQSVKVRLIYDDLTTADASFARKDVMTP
ncbi:hypothetical protein [Epibacterium sp. Ofav1-8]|uniref:hypothetical protein n=1 Tax=Epibacterium sp. Ofav1-8 TaxID=2917735 RepID=UPI001EF61911|nr:hypothetical protein [Epibacterium sp. Ofav1-8]MCG7624850.1 hypothetical protein [Epibacterium sp. Ofav1-8]